MSFDVSKMNSFAGLIALAIAAALAVQQGLDDTSRKIDRLLFQVEMLQKENAELTRNANMDLWIERARQAGSLKDLPDFPTPN